MNPITYALGNLKFHISKEILNIAFKEYQTLISSNVTSIHEIITNEIIRKKVLVDCNIVSCEEVDIFLDKCDVRHIYEQNETVIKVPKELTGNRSIIDPLSLVLNTYIAGNGMLTGGTSNQLGNLQKLTAAHTGPDVIQTSKMQMIGENTILVQSSTALFSNGILRVSIENSSNLDNIGSRFNLVFSKLVTQCIKMFIYNDMLVKLNEGYLYGGHELSVVNEIINGWSDYESMYYETLTKEWSKCQFLNSEKAMTSYIGMMLGSNM